MDSLPQKATEEPEESPPGAGAVLTKTYAFVSRSAMAILLLGLVMALVQEGLTGEVVSLFDLPRALVAFEPVALISLGLVLFLFGPALGLISLIIVFIRRRERVAMGLAIAVLTVIALTLPVKVFLLGGA
ncbi:MAG: DUF1634 domain-containing protein [Bradymonadaceae bacterium]